MAAPVTEEAPLPAPTGPIETKVVHASAAAAVAGFIVGWLVLKLPGLSGLAAPIQAGIIALLTSSAAAGAGWLADHTPRPDLNGPRVD